MPHESARSPQIVERSAPPFALDAAFPRFVPRFPWYGPDLQTLRNFLVSRLDDLSPWPGQAIELPLRDGSSDRLTAMLHPTARDDLPLVVLLHGLTGCIDSYYVLETARHLLANEFPVLRLNLRGAGSSRPLCAQEYHAGRSQDLRDALDALPAPWAQRTKVAIGYSLGGNILLKYLGEEGTAAPLAAAVSISAPMDLAAAGARFRAPRNYLYQRAILRSMKQEMARGPGPVDPALIQAGLAAKTLRDYDNGYIAPRYGFRDADDYYVQCSAKRHIGGIGVPTLIVHADDDPWIPAEIYRTIDWTALPHCRLLLTRGGGHVGFHGTGSTEPWTDRCIEIFLGLD